MSEIQIRKARLGDEAAIHEAHMRSIREVCVKDHGEEEIKGWGFRPLGNRWTKPIKEGFVWVVEENTRIYGYAYLRVFNEENQRRAHIHGLYLTPEVMGRSFGFKLAALMLNKAREESVSMVTLESTITAHEFYKRLGFKDSGEMLRVEFNGYPVRCFPMALKL